VLTPDECMKHAHNCSNKAKQPNTSKLERDVLYAMSRTWDTLAKQSTLLGTLKTASQQSL
jgi:hypothetical protein